MCFPGNRKGVSLIELLVVSVIAAMVTMGVFFSINSGVKVWQAIKQQMPEEDLALFLDRFEGDVRNYLRYGPELFEGTDTMMEFPTVVRSMMLRTTSPGRVQYRYEPSDDRLYRQQKDFSQMYQDRQPYVEHVIEGVREVHCRYLLFDAQTKELGWYDEYSGSEPPLAVSLEIVTGEDSRPQRFVKTVPVAIARVK
jgi:prepilin-type N-terminal cleavage/methylation domain-containing protein